MTQDQFSGCLLGLALGDALGAPHEGGPVEQLVWKIIGKTKDGLMRWTDDTQMSIDTAESLVSRGGLDADDLAFRFANSYRWSRGYGPAAARLLKRIARGGDWRKANRSVYPGGSFGNGGAMRAPIVGLFYARKLDDLVDATRLSATITHVHPLGIEGAVLIASATAMALSGSRPPKILQGSVLHCGLEPFTTRLKIASGWLQSGHEVQASAVARQLGNGVAASDSCVTALYVALRFIDRPFLEMQDFVAALRGDVDTIGAMAGAVWGAANGAASLPADRLAKLEERGRLETLASALFTRRA